MTEDHATPPATPRPGDALAPPAAQAAAGTAVVMSDATAGAKTGSASAAATTQRPGTPATPPLPQAADMRRNLLPGMHAPMRTFLVAVAVMVYLATLAAAAVLLVRLATAEWTAGVVSEATAQLLPRQDESADALLDRATKVAAVLRAQPGVKAVRVFDMDDSRALLRPWLGEAGLSADLPLPALIAITLDAAQPADAATLVQALEAAGFNDVKVDTHGRWVRELADLSNTALWLGVLVLALLVVALVLLVTHAARAALQANRETLQVLHLIGAQDRFIARLVQRHFLRTSFLAATGGALAALATLLLLALFSPAAGIGESIINLLFRAGRDTLNTHIFWLLIVVMTMLISLATARLAAMRILADMFRGN